MARTARTEGLNKLGSFKSRAGVLSVFDPYCSSLDVEIADCVRGSWDAYVSLRNQNSWGLRESDLTVVSSGIDPALLSFSEDVGTVMVDAATAGIYDLSDIDREYDGEFSSMAEKGLVDFGVCCPSGFGDGGYGVFVARDADGRVCGVQIVFIPEEGDVRFPDAE